MSVPSGLKFDEKGLVPVVVQDATTGGVLMLAYANAEAVGKTLETGFAWFYSRSRQRLWMKGETSGDRLRIEDVRYDCDGDTLLYRVEPLGGKACHTGNYSCFYRSIAGEAPLEGTILDELYNLVQERARNKPEKSYVYSLLKKRPNGVLQKIGEEATEVILAARDADREQVIYEMADLWFHCLVLLGQEQIDPSEVLVELRRRRR